MLAVASWARIEAILLFVVVVTAAPGVDDEDACPSDVATGPAEPAAAVTETVDASPHAPQTTAIAINTKRTGRRITN